MHLYRIHISALALALAMMIGSGASAGLIRRSGDTSLSVYAAYDKQSEEPGIGLSLSNRQQGMANLSATVFEHSILLQSSKLQKVPFGILPIYWGMTAAYSIPAERGDTDWSALYKAPQGFMTGLEVVFAKTQPTPGFALDLRASSLSKGVNPLKWISDPDVLWVGAGASYSF